jgi:hypothetical protein
VSPARSIRLIEEKRLIPHAEVERVLRRAGYSPQQIKDALRGFPDPMDERECAALESKLGISPNALMDRMGGSP